MKRTSLCRCGQPRDQHVDGVGASFITTRSPLYDANDPAGAPCLRYRGRGSRAPNTPPKVHENRAFDMSGALAALRVTINDAIDAFERDARAFAEAKITGKTDIDPTALLDDIEKRTKGRGIAALLGPSKPTDVPTATMTSHRTAHILIGAASLGKCPRALLSAVTSRHPKSSTQGQIALLSGYRKTSSSFHNALSELRSGGLIVGTEPSIAATEEGLKVSPPGPRLKGEKLVAFWLGKLGKCPGTLLDLIVGTGSIDRSSLAAATGYSETSSSFHNALSELRTLELIQRGDPIRPNEELL